MEIDEVIVDADMISIHALRKESDPRSPCTRIRRNDFNPRSP